MFKSFFYLLVSVSLTLCFPLCAQERESVDFASRPYAKTVIVGGGIDMPPYEFIDENGKPAGYNVELIQAIAEVMGLELQFKLQDWNLSREALKHGDVDMLEGVFVTDIRADEFNFSLPYLTVHHAVFARKDSPAVDSVGELKGSKVIIHRSSLMHDYLIHKGQDKDLFIAENPANALRSLASGKYDYAVLPLLPGIYLSQSLKLTNIVPVSASIMSSPYAFAAAPDNHRLIAQLNEGLAIIKQTGRYQQIHEKWLGVGELHQINLRLILRYILLAVTPLLLILGAFALWSRTLHRQVAIRTADLELEIKERKQAEEALRLNQQQLIQADKMAALGVLLSGVAHEINNPNGLILLNLPTLKRALADIYVILEEHYERNGDFSVGSIPYTIMRDEIPRMVDDMQHSAVRIKRIVDDLKNFARKNDVQEKAPVDFNVIVQTALRLLDNNIKKSTHAFEASYAALPPMYANAQRLEQVIINLILNACQALTHPDQSITVATRYDESRGLIIFEVADQGCGIIQEDLTKLTDPFYTTKRDSGGTGLGLSVSLKIVKEHQGKLHFSSVPGKGTTATLYLPIEQDYDDTE